MNTAIKVPVIIMYVVNRTQKNKAFLKDKRYLYIPGENQQLRH